MSYCPHTQLIYFYLLDNPAAGHKNTFRENRTYFCNSPIFPNLSSKCFQSRFWCYLFLFNQAFNGKTLSRDYTVDLYVELCLVYYIQNT